MATMFGIILSKLCLSCKKL